MRAHRTSLALALCLAAFHCGPGRRGHGDGSGGGDGDGDGDGDGPACDRDADGYQALDCGGDDCDDGAAGVHPGAADAPWQSERLGFSGEWVSYAIDADGARHLVTGQGLYGIQYATDRTGTWTTEVLEAARYQGHQTGLAIDASGAAHVVWVPEASRELRYATNAGGGWVIETVDATRNVDYPCLAIGDDGVVHVAYTDQDSFDVRVGTRDGGGWRTESIGARAIGLAMALGPDGAVHLAFGNPGVGGGAPSHATDASGSWTIDATGAEYPAGAGSAPAIALADDGTVRVAWVAAEAEPVLRVASNDSGRFVEQDVATLGAYGGAPSIAIDERGRVHVAATQATEWEDAAVLHAISDGTGWTVDTIATGRGGIVRIDPDGIAAILYAARDFELAVSHHAPADGIDDDCDGIADGRSGLAPEQTTVGLSDPEAAALCDWALGLQGGAGSRHTCGGATITVGSTEDCVATRGMCPTIEDFEACMLAIGADVCAVAGGLPPACAACSSGVDPDRTLMQLSSNDWQTWCDWSVSTQGGAGKVTSCEGGSVTVRSVDDCVAGSGAFARCTVTVGEADACAIAMAEDACTGMDAPACAGLMSCLLGG